MSLRWLPNAICIVRIALVAPSIALLLAERFDQALALIVLAGLSDGLDGYLAKTFDWRTKLGGLLDPVADKLLITSVFLTLTYLGLVPVALTGIVVGRDVVIVLGASLYQLTIGDVRGEPTAISKLNTACQLGFVVFTITVAAFDWPARISLVALGAAVVFTSVNSGLNYVLAWSKRAWRAKHRALQ
jgi:cardiolipin synthase